MYNNTFFFEFMTKGYDDCSPSLGEEISSLDNQYDNSETSLCPDNMEDFAQSDLSINNNKKMKKNNSTKSDNSEKLSNVKTKENTTSNNLGKKRPHDKFSSDNLIRKLKTKLFESIRKYINNILSSTPKNDQKSEHNLILLKINQETIYNATIVNNVNLLNLKLKDIFSTDISKKVESHGLDYNRKVIEKIYEEKNNTRAIEVLERTFFECLEQFRGSKNYVELAGLEKNLEDFKKKNFEDKDYIETFDYFLNTFENYLSRSMKKNSKTKS